MAAASDVAALHAGRVLVVVAGVTGCAGVRCADRFGPG